MLTNPASDIDVLRIINTPARGIGATSVERLLAFAERSHTTVMEALARVAEPRGGVATARAADLGAAAAGRLASFHALMEHLAARVANVSPSDLLGEILERSGYLTALRAEDTAESEARLENLAELKSSLYDYEQEAVAAGEEVSVEGYLERVSLQSDVDAMKDGSRVTLMTVHGAKGLEFELVVLTGMEQDMFPYRGMTPGGDHELEEERRLAYVAITRARSRLVVTHAETRQIFGTTRLGGPSPFLAQMPADAVTAEDHRGARTPPRPAGSSRATTAPDTAMARGATRKRCLPSTTWPPASDTSTRTSSTNGPGGADEAGGAAMRCGARVVHAQFGEGEIRSVVEASEPAVVVAFPGRGEKKILARFLTLVGGGP